LNNIFVCSWIFIAGITRDLHTSFTLLTIVAISWPRSRRQLNKNTIFYIRR